MKPKSIDIACLVTLLMLLWPFNGCNYARMTTDEAYDTYEAELPRMPEGSIPTDGNIVAYRMLGAAALQNPLPASDPVLNRGRLVYGFYCDHCHGPGGNGRGTVGQSFAPLPTDLASSRVQTQNDGRLYFKIAYGFQRHPDLSHTLVESDLWSVIHYLRRLPEEKAALAQ